MSPKKIIVLTIFFCLFLGLTTVEVFADQVVDKFTEFRYRVIIDSDNSLWNCLFLFWPENREFLWREKNGDNEYGPFHEIIVYNKKGKVAVVFFTQGEVSSFARVDFGEDSREELSPEQKKTLLDAQNFSRIAKPGDTYTADYMTSENSHKILLKAQDFCYLEIGGKPINTLYFEGKVFKNNKKFINLKFWVIKEGELEGQVGKCRVAVKNSFWPKFVIEIKN